MTKEQGKGVKVVDGDGQGAYLGGYRHGHAGADPANNPVGGVLSEMEPLVKEQNGGDGGKAHLKTHVEEEVGIVEQQEEGRGKQGVERTVAPSQEVGREQKRSHDAGPGRRGG